MLFVLSAAVRFHSKPVVETAIRSPPRLGQKAKALVAELRRLDAKDIRKQLHVNEALAREYEKHLVNFEAQQPVPACCLYDSPLYRALDASSLDHEDATYCNKHLRVYSGLYGLLRPFDEIQPFSLPVTLGTKLTTSKGKFLRDYWRESITKELSEGLSRLPMPVLIDCTGENDAEAVYDLDALPEYTSVTRIDFKMNGKDAFGEAMGEFVRWAIENRCETVEEILDFRGHVEDDQPATFRVVPKLSDERTITFEENVGLGSDGGWSKRMNESGLSRRQFKKEELSGKNRYKRSEMNKAMAVDKRKARGKNAVY